MNENSVIRDGDIVESPVAIYNAYTLARMRDAGWSNEGLLRAGWAVARFAMSAPSPLSHSLAPEGGLYSGAPVVAAVDEALYTAEEVAEAMEVLRGRNGSSAITDDALAEMERVLLAAAPAAQVAECICDGATYRPDQARPFLINRSCPRHGEQKAAAPAVVVDEAMVERACRAVKYWCNSWDDLKEIGRASFKAEMRKALAAALNQGKANG